MPEVRTKQKLTAKPEAKPKVKRGALRTTARLMKLVAPLTGPMVLAVLCGVVGNLCAIAIPVASSLVLVAVLGLAEGIPFAPLLGLMALAGVLRSVCRYGEQRLNHYIAFTLLAHIRGQVFATLRRLAPARLEGRDKGDLIALITTDIELLEVFYAHTVSPVAIAVLVSLIMCAYMLLIHPLFLLIAAASYLVVGLLLPSFNGWMIRERGQQFRAEFASLNSFLFDSLRGVGQSIQYGEGPRRLKTLVERSEKLAGYQKRLKLAEGRSSAVTDATIFFASVLMLVTGILLRQAGVVGFEAVLLSTVGLISSFGPVIALSALSNNLAQTFASANRVFDLMDEQPVVEEVTTGATVGFEGARLSEVSFAYDEVQVLHELSLAVGKGQIVGLVGRSGSGKSTVLKLLMRFWDVNSGSITLSGRELGSLNTDCLRSLQGYMTQDTQLFNDTLLNNLRIARPEATLEEVEQACRRASLYEFINSLPQGFETTVGELGERLSGGERQRIGLARVFLHDAPLILLDEPTSNLDSLNEAVILKSLYESRRNKTVVLVSHRHSTMRIADSVHKVHNGRLS